MDPDFYESDLDDLLEVPLWSEAHRALESSDGDNARRSGEGTYHDLYEVIPLWLYARECLEDDTVRSSTSNAGNDSTPNTTTRRRRRNVPSNLPRPILTRIFELLQSSFTRPIYADPLSDDYNNDEVTENDTQNPYAWLPSVTLVCKPWRNAAYSSAFLWTHIDLLYPKEVVRSLLIMSDTESLYIRGDTRALEAAELYENEREEEEADLEIKIELVTDEQRRIRELDLTLSSHKYFKMVPWKNIFKSPWPFLTLLFVSFPPLARESAQQRKKRELGPFITRNFPVLEGLVFDGVYMKWGDSELERLELLEMRNVDGCGERAAFDAFVNRCTRLRLGNVKVEACRFGEPEPTQHSERGRKNRQQ